MNMGHHGIWGKGNGTFPPNFFDTSVKVPFLVSWPDVLPKKRVTDAMCSQYDFMETLLDLLDMEEEIPKELADSLPGKSFKEVLVSGKETEERAIMIFDEYGPNRMIRTKEWKLVHRYPYGPDELYHLTEDPDEQINLAEEEGFREIREGLLDQMIRWFDRYVDPRMDAAREAVTGFGQIGRCGYYSEGKKVYLKEKE